MTSEQILQELQKRKLLDEDSALKLKRDIFLSGRSAEELIYGQQLVADQKMAEIKSEYLRVPHQKVSLDAITAKVLELIPEEIVRTYGVVPLSRSEDTLLVGMLNPDDDKVQSRASDVHVEPQERYLRLRFRVDGDLHEAASLPTELSQPIASRIKVMSNLKIDETRVPQDGRFRARIFDREIDFRVATFP